MCVCARSFENRASLRKDFVSSQRPISANGVNSVTLGPKWTVDGYERKGFLSTPKSMS